MAPVGLLVELPSYARTCLPLNPCMLKTAGGLLFAAWTVTPGLQKVIVSTPGFIQFPLYKLGILYPLSLSGTYRGRLKKNLSLIVSLSSA